ncbi:MAG: 16S rRNA (cytidine(1402)-2'-O)-methyltransferase [Bacillota bacterium]|nr:16S rRNA (cytidine(1402)-2'-O)-methyltransferase [Bacillota bacterium]
MALYLVASPIGNLKDISLRALETLERADLIYCEDTRVSAKLLSHYKIKASLRSYHEHSPEAKRSEILSLLRDGKDIAYLSDAGMPCISDPGKELVKLAVEHDIEYTVIPGASAAVCAFALSGMDEARFTFAGFLDRNRVRAELEALKDLTHPVIFYESPHRVQALLEEMLAVLGDRRISIARELSKLHESVLHGTIGELLEHEEIRNPKGEFALVVEGSRAEALILSDQDILKIGRKRLEDGEKLSAIAKELAKMGSLSRAEIYKELSN